MNRLAILVAVAALGCKNEQCEKYVEMTMKCPDEDIAAMSSKEKAQFESMLSGMCVGAMKGETGGATGETLAMVEEMNATIKRKATCVAKAKTCEEAKKCEDDDPSSNDATSK